MTEPIRLLHVASHIEARGGMNTLLRRQRERAPRDVFIGLFDRPAGRGQGETLHLGGRAWTTPAQLRRCFARAVDGTPPADAAVYHNAWGVAWFAARDRAARRIAVIHATVAGFEAFLQAQGGLLDGMICFTRPMAEICRQALPELAGDRCAVLRHPIGEPPVAWVDRPAGGPLRLGYAGRLVRQDKRLDRVAPFLARLDALGVAWRFDFLGDGRMRGELERIFRGDRRVVFHGWQGGRAYWETLARWDGIVFFSDHESGPLSLLEAMALGVIPIYPRLGASQGDEYTPMVDPRGWYAAGDVDAAAGAVCAIFAGPAAIIGAARERARQLVLPHCRCDYEGEFTAAAAGIVAMPRISATAPRRRWRLADFLPIGLLARIWPHAFLR